MFWLKTSESPKLVLANIFVICDALVLLLVELVVLSVVDVLFACVWTFSSPGVLFSGDATGKVTGLRTLTGDKDLESRCCKCCGRLESLSLDRTGFMLLLVEEELGLVVGLDAVVFTDKLLDALLTEDFFRVLVPLELERSRKILKLSIRGLVLARSRCGVLVDCCFFVDLLGGLSVSAREFSCRLLLEPEKELPIVFCLRSLIKNIKKEFECVVKVSLASSYICSTTKMLKFQRV